MDTRKHINIYMDFDTIQRKLYFIIDYCFIDE